MTSRRRKTASSPFTDAKLLDALLTRGAAKLSPAELEEVTQLAVAVSAGQIEKLAQHTRDRMMRLARQCGALIAEKTPTTYAEFRDMKERERARTPGEAVAEDVLSEKSRRQAMGNMLAARRRTV